MPSKPGGATINVEMKRVGTIPIPTIIPGTTYELASYPWPMQITAGDISRDGKIIILRTYYGKCLFWYRSINSAYFHHYIYIYIYIYITINYIIPNQGARMWSRKTTTAETVESALTSNKGHELELCTEPQGESIAIKHDNTGFYTISEASRKKNANKNGVPIYYYSF